MAINRFYTVFKGRIPGVYDNIDDVLEQVDGVDGAYFKGYSTSAAAAEAFRKDVRKEEVEFGNMLAKAGSVSIPADGKPDYMTIPEIDLSGWAVDASCMGNPGIMEYRGVELMTGRELFRVGPFKDGTNNIGEFLAIVHALALMEKTGERHPIYSDSVTGISWVNKRKIRTQLKETPDNRILFEMMARGLNWLNTHSFRVKILKWQTSLWGEIPADFDRK